MFASLPVNSVPSWVSRDTCPATLVIIRRLFTVVAVHRSEKRRVECRITAGRGRLPSKRHRAYRLRNQWLVLQGNERTKGQYVMMCTPKKNQSFPCLWVTGLSHSGSPVAVPQQLRRHTGDVLTCLRPHPCVCPPEQRKQQQHTHGNSIVAGSQTF